MMDEKYLSKEEVELVLCALNQQRSNLCGEETAYACAGNRDRWCEKMNLIDSTFRKLKLREV